MEAAQLEPVATSCHAHTHIKEGVVGTGSDPANSTNDHATGKAAPWKSPTEACPPRAQA
jgi:hypothetical protein